MKSTLEEQQAFITVVDCGSITAAERLGITVSGVSRALNRLEQKLGTTLLRRTTRRLELTKKGKPSRPLPTHPGRRGRGRRGPARPPRPAQRPAAGQRRAKLYAVCDCPGDCEFRARYPGITQSWITDCFVDLLEQRVDLAIRIGALEDSSLHARPLGHSALRVLASPA